MTLEEKNIMLKNGTAVREINMIFKVKNLKSKIKVFKKSLINRAKKHGIYENFGQSEIAQIENWMSVNSIFPGSDKYIKSMPHLERFKEWCENYRGGGLE